MNFYSTKYMPNDTVSSHNTEKGPTTRSSSEALLKEVVPRSSNASNRASKLLDKRKRPTVAVGSKSETLKKMTPSPLRRSERTRNSSSDRSPSTSTSSGSKKHVTRKKLTFGTKDASKDERNDAGTSSKLNVRNIHARNYRASFQILNRDCPKESNSTDKSVNRSIPEYNKGGSKIDECFKGNGLHHKAVSKDGTLPSELAKVNDMSAESRLTGPVKKLLGGNVTLGSRVPSNATSHEISGGAPETVLPDCSGEELLHMLGSKNSNLNENSIRKCNGHDEAENLPSSKRKRTIMDMDSDIPAKLVDDDNCNLILDPGLSRLCCNIVETSGPFSKSIRGVSLSDAQRDLGKLINNLDTPSSKYYNGKSPARKNEGKSGDSVERPQGNNVETEKIRKRQRSLHLSLKPGIVKLCEILQFPDNIKSMVENCLEYTMDNYQISTEPVAVSILQAFQLSLCWTAASLLRHKFDLEASLVLAKRHLNFDCKKDVVDEINARLMDLKDNFLLLTGNSKFIGSPKASESCSVYSNTELTPEVELTEKDISKNIKGTQMRKNKWRELLHMQQEHKHKLEKDIESEKAYFVRRSEIELAAIRSCSFSDGMRNEKLKVFNSEYDKRKEELRSQHEVLLKDLETKQLESRLKFQESWAPDELLNIDSSKELGTPNNAPIILLPYDVADVNEMDIMASEDGPVSGYEGHGIGENDDQRSNISKNSNSGEQCSDGATIMEDVGEGCGNFSREFRDNCGQTTVTMVLPSSNGEICDGEASNVPDGEVAPALQKTSSSNDDSSLQGKLDGTILSEPVCGFSTNVNANGFIDSDKNMVSSNSQAPEEHIPSVSTMSMLSCKDTAQIHEAGDVNGSNNAGAMKSPLSVKNLGSLQDIHGVNVMCMPNGQISEQFGEDDGGNGSNNVVTLNSLLNDERSVDGNLSDREVHEEMPETVGITPLSVDQISAGAVNVSVSNKVLPSTCGTASLNAYAINLLNQPSLEKQNPFQFSSSIPTGQNRVEVSETSHDWASASELDREVVVEFPITVKNTDYPANAAPLSSFPTDQISDGGLVDEVLSSTPCSSSSQSNGHPTTVSLLNPPSSKQQITTNEENRHEQGQLTDNAVVNISTTLDHQEGVHKTMIENALSQETLVSTLVDIVEPQEQVQPLSPIVSPHSPVDMLPANRSNHISMVMETPEQVQQLPSSGLPSSDRDLSNLHLVDGENRVAINEDALCSQIPEGSTLVQNHAREQPPLNLEVDQRQSVASLVSNMVHDFFVPGGVRGQYSDIRNLSTHGIMNNHPMQTITQSASRIAPPLCLDPLSNEFERIRKLTEQHKKNHEDARLQLKCDFEKKREEIRMKYLIELEEIEAVFQKARENQDTQLSLINRHKILSDAFSAVKSDHVFSYPGGTQQDAGFSQLSQLQNTIATPSSCGPPPAASLQSLNATTGSQAMVPPHLQPAYNTSGVLGGVSARLPHINSTSPPLGNHQAAGARARPPHINSISSSLGNLHTGWEIRAPAPHLQPIRPPTSAPFSSLNTVSHGMPSHPALGNSSASYLLYSQFRPRPMPTISQSDSHRGHWHENTSGFPIPNVSSVNANNQFSINLSNPCMSDLASLNPSKSCTSSMPANSAHDTTHPDVLCLSDDD